MENKLAPTSMLTRKPIGVKSKKCSGLPKPVGAKTGLNENVKKAQDAKNKQIKRSNEDNPEPKRKRAAFGDITNAIQKKKDVDKPVKKKNKQKGVLLVPRPSNKPTSTGVGGDTSFDIIELSQGSNSSIGSSNFSQSLSSQHSIFSSQSQSQNKVSQSSVEDQNEKNNKLSQNKSQEEEVLWDDIDSPTLSDPGMIGLYAAHIFSYYKERESKFSIDDYMVRQHEITASMRSVLVDWLVEIQENFELHHETLYLSVKLLDHYLARSIITRENLQLLGASCLFLACKFDERCPPVLDDFLYICDDAYNRDQIITMERDLLQTLDFDIGIPLSYRFLRRYWRCAQTSPLLLTLARYVLESSLLTYKYVLERDSKMAAASLLLAIKMTDTAKWDVTLEHYTGYTEADLIQLTIDLNTMISDGPAKNLSTIHSKYSHVIFQRVTLIPPLNREQINALRMQIAEEPMVASPIPSKTVIQHSISPAKDDDIVIMDLS